jgi:chromosomal replication initiation ATPase DnaA
MSTKPHQLLLPFPQAHAYDSREFLAAASNQEALAWLDSDWPDRRLGLWGPAGCGKSHLLHIWAGLAGAPILAGQGLCDLDALPDQGALAVDNADSVASEPLLLHLLNIARDRGLRLLLAGRTAPSRWPVSLPDLSSRLRAIAAVEIRAPSDDLLAALLVRLLSDRQLSVAQSVQNWLLNRLPRSPAALQQAVAKLDRGSLTFGKAITRPLAARILAAEGNSVTDADEVSISGVDPSTRSPTFL